MFGVMTKTSVLSDKNINLHKFKCSHWLKYSLQSECHVTFTNRAISVNIFRLASSSTQTKNSTDQKFSERFNFCFDCPFGATMWSGCDVSAIAPAKNAKQKKKLRELQLAERELDPSELLSLVESSAVVLQWCANQMAKGILCWKPGYSSKFQQILAHL